MNLNCCWLIHWLGLAIVMSLPFSVAVAEGGKEATLDRLFLTPQQRTMIDKERFLYEQKEKGNGNDSTTTQAKKTQQIALNAILLGQKNVVWINQVQIDQQITLYGVMINPSRATTKGLWLKTPKGSRFLKLGQVYLLEQDKVVERYEAM